MTQPRRPARLSRRVLAFADYHDEFTLQTARQTFEDVSYDRLCAVMTNLTNNGYLSRIIRGKGGLHHWQHAIYRITQDGRRRLELLNQDKRI